MDSRLLALLATLAIAACATSGAPTGLAPAPEYDGDFKSLWTDGNAELAGYRLVFPRYGELRAGTAVTVFVTEPFAEGDRVKHEGAERPPESVFPVMKLNLMQDFVTGVYDYNTMATVFVALEPMAGRLAGHPTKVSYSSQEWCGQVYAQALFDRESVRHAVHSYFDGEADLQETIGYPEDGLAEDALLLWARGMAAPFLEPGESRDVALLRSLELCRLSHVALEWERARLTRSPGSAEITVPAGTFTVEEHTVTIAAGAARAVWPPAASTRALPGRTWIFRVEKDAPHRLIMWERSDGLRAELTGVGRMPYWKLNAESFRSKRRELGLPETR